MEDTQAVYKSVYDLFVPKAPEPVSPDPTEFTLKKWAIFIYGTPYRPVEMTYPVLIGQIYGHPRYESGEEVTTTRLVEINILKGYAKTRINKYNISQADVDPIFKKWISSQGMTLEQFNMAILER